MDGGGYLLGSRSSKMIGCCRFNDVPRLALLLAARHRQGALQQRAHPPQRTQQRRRGGSGRPQQRAHPPHPSRTKAFSCWSNGAAADPAAPPRWIPPAPNRPKRGGFGGFSSSPVDCLGCCPPPPRTPPTDATGMSRRRLNDEDAAMLDECMASRTAAECSRCLNESAQVVPAEVGPSDAESSGASRPSPPP